MLIVHLVVGLAGGFLLALWSWAVGYSLWAVAGFYVLGLHLGIVAGVAVLLLTSRRARPEEKSDRLTNRA